MNFMETRGGQQFINHTVPSLVKAVNALTAQMERMNGLAEMEVLNKTQAKRNEAFAQVLRYAETAEEGEWSNNICRQQLRSLWTACCIYNNWDADTAAYDNALREVWEAVIQKFDIEGSDDIFADFDCFDDFMCEFLV